MYGFLNNCPESGIDAADASLASTQRDYRHERELTRERARTAEVEEDVRSASARADLAEAKQADLTTIHTALLTNTELSRQILENSTDCIKVLDLDGRLEFMSAGGMRVMEVDDFAPLAMCPWVEFWHGEQRVLAQKAVSAAKAGEVGRFVGPTPTAKGNMRWWEVVVSPIRGPDGSIEKLLSISRDVTARHAADDHQRMLFEEMRHRIKNTLTTTLGVVEQSLRGAATKDEARNAIRARLVAMGKAHDLLIENEWISADIREVVAGAMGAYVGDGPRVAMTGDPVLLTSRAALTLAMLLNELSTNAIKYGAWSTKVGQVAISWDAEGDQFHFRWSEQHGPPVAPPARRSFGTRLIETALPGTLEGVATLRFERTGLVFEFRAPLVSLTAPTGVAQKEL
jgi:two-component sensor histidine kinase/PAS domain-containing protein